MMTKKKDSDVIFRRIRGRIVPIRRRVAKVSDFAETGSAALSVGALAGISTAKFIESPKFKPRVAINSFLVRKRSKIPRTLQRGIEKGLLAPFKIRKFSGRLGIAAGALGTVGFLLSPAKLDDQLEKLNRRQ